VRRAIAAGLARGDARLDRVAAGLGMRPRTLQRRLEAERLTYSDLLETVRQDLALAMIREGTLPLGAIAGILGYGRPAAFTRAVRRWTGRPPSRLRTDAMRGTAV
jgi:AraC-like DNA-binding protein